MTLSAVPERAREHYFNCPDPPWECRVCKEVEWYIDRYDKGDIGIAEGEEG